MESLPVSNYYISGLDFRYQGDRYVYIYGENNLDKLAKDISQWSLIGCVQIDPSNLEDNHYHLRDDDILYYLPVRYFKYWNEEWFCLTACKYHITACKYVPKQFLTYSFYMQLLEHHRGILEYIPEEFHTAELCMLAVKRSGYNLAHIKNKTTELCRIACEGPGIFLHLVPNEFLTYQLCLETVIKQSKECDILQDVPEEYHTYELTKIAVTNRYTNIRFIKNPSYELVQIAFNQSVKAVYHLPKEYRTYEAYFNALQHDISDLSCFPKEFLTKEVFDFILSKSDRIPYNGLKYYEEKHDLYVYALEKDGFFIKIINYPPIELCVVACKQNPATIKIITTKIREPIDVFLKLVL